MISIIIQDCKLYSAYFINNEKVKKIDNLSKMLSITTLNTFCNLESSFVTGNVFPSYAYDSYKCILYCSKNNKLFETK